MANLSNLLATLGGPLRGGAGLAALGVNRFNALLETVRGLAAGDNLVAGRGIRLDKTRGQVVITSDATSRNLATPTPTHGFQVLPTPLPHTDDVKRVVVVRGLLNYEEPTVGGVALGHEPAPEIEVPSSGYIVLEGDFTLFGSLLSASIAFFAEAPTNATNTPTKGRIVLAEVTLSGSGAETVLAIEAPQPVTGSLQVQKCGVSTYYFGGV